MRHSLVSSRPYIYEVNISAFPLTTMTTTTTTAQRRGRNLTLRMIGQCYIKFYLRDYHFQRAQKFSGAAHLSKLQLSDTSRTNQDEDGDGGAPVDDYWHLYTS